MVEKTQYKAIRKGTGQSYMRNSELKAYLEKYGMLKPVKEKPNAS